MENLCINIKKEVEIIDNTQELSIASLQVFTSSKSYEKVKSHINIDIVNPMPAIKDTKNTE